MSGISMDCQFSFGPNGAFFVKSSTLWAWSDHKLPEPLRSVLEDTNNPLHCKQPHDVAFAIEPGVYSMYWTTKANQEMYEADYLPSYYSKLAAFIANKSARTTFGPNHSYFSTTESGLSWQNLPDVLETTILNRIRIGRPHTVALGVQGAWIVLFEDGHISFSVPQLQNLYPNVFALIHNAEENKKRKGIAYVALNPFATGQYFMAFGDGSSLFTLPNEMHREVQGVAATIRPLPAGNSGGGNDAAGLMVASAKFQLAVQQNMAMQSLFYPRY
ncbi:hypothetical protein MIND_00944800 [Mycena indigotica]|uniref:Uncharacterized protein n=1 Tax=Mycena indigotica TaxID=2126181 RepID=A0A8H6VWY5_9AGAR|nr:uncharacterized protein MIND_00944800 [Mycena indigotica]KAF7297119.1 hypothetical protein MIND_00944800 [Mycena indigotica]